MPGNTFLDLLEHAGPVFVNARSPLPDNAQRRVRALEEMKKVAGDVLSWGEEEEVEEEVEEEEVEEVEEYFCCLACCLLMKQRIWRPLAALCVHAVAKGMEKAKQDAFDNARLKVIQDGYERAFDCLNRALTADEAGQRGQALDLYRQGRQHLLRATSVPSQGPECAGSSWDAARQMQAKMRETLNNITTRLAILETSGPAPDAADATTTTTGPQQALDPKLSAGGKPERPVSPKRGVAPVSPVSRRPAVPPPPAEQPPAYSPQAADGHLSISYGTESGELSLVGQEYYTQKSNTSTASSSSSCSSSVPPHPPPESLGEEAEELLLLPHGVQMFFVTPDGQVSAPSYPGVLRLVRFTAQPPSGAPSRPPAFLQVCDWLYPLMSSESPVLLCNTGVFMFPDMMAPGPGYYVGVVLSAELPAADRELFQDLLAQMTDLRVQPPDEDADSINLSQKVPLSSQRGGASTTTSSSSPSSSPSSSSSSSAAALTQRQQQASPGGEKKEKEKEKKGEEQQQEEEEEDRLPEWSEKVASGILTGASWLSWGLVKGAEYTGIAITKGATKLREHITPEDTPTHINPGNITTNVASETVTTIKHKYGSAAGHATDLAMNSAINVGVTAFNIDNLGIKAVVKRTGKQTAAALLQDYKIQEPPGHERQLEKTKK
ncbi:hypothetical protein CRUP_034205 [Coryphaenoides rupestris]|nr:hypothetical protein CRUP_034205 [Coryphaenoides rupestris]